MKFLQVRLQSKLRINKNTICRLAHVRLSMCVCVSRLKRLANRKQQNEGRKSGRLAGKNIQRLRQRQTDECA